MSGIVYFMVRWTSGLSRNTFNVEITGSNPVRTTQLKISSYGEVVNVSVCKTDILCSNHSGSSKILKL